MTKKQILIVEDDRIVSEDIKRRLEKAGFAISGCIPSGEKAIKSIQGNKPDLVLMDIMLEGQMDGIEAANQIRQQFKIPIVYLTAYTDDVLLERAKITKPFGYIVKPFQDRELESTIEIALYMHKTEDEKQKFQNQLQQSYKIEAIETLAGGIAHKFNNSLSVITGNIELLKMAIPDNKDIDHYADRMMVSVQNMANLSNQLLAYAEGGKYQPKSLSLTNFLNNTLSTIKRKITSTIKMETDIPANIFNMKGDRTQIQMLLSAIIENSVEAMENEGCIKIIVKNKEVKDKFAQQHPGLKTGSYVCLRIVDDGKGMDEETRRRIFEPFFTTNFQGRGLGMAAAYGIVKNHNGWIDVDSEPGRGTMIDIYLPAVDVPIKKTLEPDMEILIGTETILLIEDEEMIMTVEKTMLERLGYSVLPAKSGEDAIDIVKNFNGNIDLAILDMGLPDMGGEELYPLLMGFRPNLKVIVCSGYSVDGPAQDVLDAGAQAFIQKPFAFTELSAKLRLVIERRKHERFKVKKEAVANPQSDISRQGKIIEISENGLAFTYIESKKRLGEFSEVAISIVDENFNLNNMPCKTISEVELSNSSPSETERRIRYGILFGELTPDQTDQLELLIQNHTM